MTVGKDGGRHGAAIADSYTMCKPASSSGSPVIAMGAESWNYLRHFGRDAMMRERVIGVDSVLEKAGGLEAERDWGELLSLGEQQSVSLARMALAAPRYALLDRPGTVLDVEAVERALDFLAAQSITLVTFAGDAEPASRHDARLTLAGDGSWRLEPIARART